MIDRFMTFGNSETLRRKYVKASAGVGYIARGSFMTLLAVCHPSSVPGT